MTTYGETILTMERNDAHAQEVEARAWQLYLQWREDRLASGYASEPETWAVRMGQCFDEAEAWIKIAEERRAGGA